ncbi:GNAT family N-acetyltransferase [Actinacidiphila glaucinigra]|uniref:GNAT family N-acetyltransferase n=1 Tax=Actinacidiphila glaucinigra TaxID=235986 RepID=UPI0033BC8BF8
MSTEDVLPWADLLDRAERADRVGEHYDLQDIAGQLSEPGLDLGLGTFSAWDGERMVGYALVRPRSYGQNRPALAHEGVVDPEFRGRGIGGALLGWATTRSAGLTERAGLRVQASDRVPGYRALLERHGFEPSSWLVDLERPLDAEPQTVAVPDPAIAPARIDSLPEDPVKACYLDAFGAAELDWARLRNAAAYRPDLSFAAMNRARGGRSRLSCSPATSRPTPRHAASARSTSRVWRRGDGRGRCHCSLLSYDTDAAMPHPTPVWEVFRTEDVFRSSVHQRNPNN